MIALRLVIDTNIIVSAALKPYGLERTVLLLSMTKPSRLYVTAPIFSEYSEVLRRPALGIRKGLTNQLLQIIRNRAFFLVPSRLLGVTKDPDDNKFIECADAARADYLLTGNHRHFPKFWKRTKVISSREFIGIVSPYLAP